MPVEWRILTPQKREERSQLVKELRDEYHLGENSPNTEPRIIIDERTPNGNLRLFVVWSKFAEYSRSERSDIIVDAFDADGMLSALDFVRLTVAMGMTPEEWERFKNLPEK